MHIVTNDPKDTDKFMELVNATHDIKRIQKILANKHSHSDQIKAIKKLLEGGSKNE